MNTVQYILKNRPLTYKEKLRAKTLGRPTPDLEIKKTTCVKGRELTRYFRRDTTYRKFSWMCGCPEVNKLFCFVCLLSNNSSPSSWIIQGVNDLQHLSERASKHAKNSDHLHYLIDYNVLDKTAILKQYVSNIRTHNEKVAKNRHVLRRVIMRIKLCGAFQNNVETADQDIFHGLVDFASELDSLLLDHPTEATVSKVTSKTVLNELLDAMLQVCRDEMLEQISKSNYVSIEGDEISDSFNRRRLILIVRYVFEGEIFERFWGFLHLEEQAVEKIAGVVMEELDSFGLPETKLIAQSYDAAFLMSGRKGGVQAIIRQKYPGAFYIHSYSQQSDVLLEKAALCHKKLKIFFAELHSFTVFFARTSAILDEITTETPTHWNFLTRTIEALHRHKEYICDCLEEILDLENDTKAIGEVNGLLRILDSVDFCYFLGVFHCITPHVDAFFNQVRSREVNSLYIGTCLEHFESQITEIVRTKLEKESSEGPSISKRPRLVDLPEKNRVVMKIFCDVLLNQIKDRYQFTGHLDAAYLFSPTLRNTHKENFPEDSFKCTVEAYPFIDSDKLKTELTVIYDRDDMRYDSVLPLLTFINRKNLQEDLSETHKLLNIL